MSKRTCRVCGHNEDRHYINYAYGPDCLDCDGLIEKRSHIFDVAPEQPVADTLREQVEDAVADACMEYVADQYAGTGLPGEKAANRILALMEQPAPEQPTPQPSSPQWDEWQRVANAMDCTVEGSGSRADADDFVRNALTELDMANGCLDMVAEVLAAHLGEDAMRATPAMMYPEAIQTAIARRVTEETAALAARIAELEAREPDRWVVIYGMPGDPDSREYWDDKDEAERCAVDLREDGYGRVSICPVFIGPSVQEGDHA